MQKLATALLLAAGLMVTPAAHAQSWGGYERGGDYRGYNQGNRGNYGYDRRSDRNYALSVTCSGQRARTLENRLQEEYREREIGQWDASRMQRSIDRLQNQAWRECREGDWRAVWNISLQYDQIGNWIDREAHGRWRGR